eukprot:scaffold139619_cov17-Prasinocladus_malaysianus.AAC.1
MFVLWELTKPTAVLQSCALTAEHLVVPATYKLALLYVWSELPFMSEIGLIAEAEDFFFFMHITCMLVVDQAGSCLAY